MVGRTVQQYQLVEKLGAGGMGDVYKALDTRLNRFVAIKVLSPGVSADPEYRRRFIQEAQAASALNHPNIITIYDVVHDGDTQYMVMEYVSGKTLLELVPQDGMQPAEVVRYAAQITDALGAAHAAGFIHRDLKPANIMITGSGLVKVLDFGLAKLLEWPVGEHSGNTVTAINNPLTVAGAIMGTVNYMSPEQAGGGRLDARSDIFSFGAVLYEMLTGQKAFQGSSPISTLSAVMRDDARPIVELTNLVPAGLEQIVLCCLNKDPDQRFQSMREITAALGALRPLLDAGAWESPPTVRTFAPSPQPVTPLLQPATRSASKLPVVSAVFLVVAVVGGGFWWANTHPSAPLRVLPAIPPAATRPADGTLTNDSIIDMATGKVEPSVIASQIRASKTNFDMSPAEVIRLSKAGVPADVIEVMRNPQAPPPPAVTAVIVSDGLPIHLTLIEDVPTKAASGDEVRFKVAHSLRVDGTLVVPEGAEAIGSVVDGAKRKILGFGGNMTFSLQKVDALDGRKLTIRATPARGRDGISKHALSTGGHKPKDVAATAGSAFVGYIDGPQTVMAKK